MRAFTLVEAMIVVAIVGILAGLAVPSLTPLANHYRALEGARSVLAAVTQGRGLSQRTNEPVEVFVDADRIVLRTPSFAAGTSPEAIRKVVVAFNEDRVIHLGEGARVARLELVSGGVTTTQPAGTQDATFRFCPSSDTYFRSGTAGVPVCGVGNLASHNARLVVELKGERFAVDVRAALGSIDMRQMP